MSAAPEVDDDDDELPRAFGSYLLLQNFARGGMGEVYLAKSGGIAGLERTCVLKKLRSELTRDREYVTRFIDEARVVVTLSHANICNVFDVGRVVRSTPKGNLEEYYLAMDYVSGRDLRTLQDRCIKAQKAPQPATTLHLVCETLQALDYAHRRKHPNTGEPLNLVHRDVSPQNVLVSYEGEVKLIDFGLAASRLKVERTQPNVVMGKMAYMAPEQARGDPIDARADLFACGVLCYELLTNERFYEGMTANDIWQVAGRGGFVPRAWSTLDGPLASIVSRAVHPDAKRRFASCGDFREALLAYSHARWPGIGERSLRALMEELFVEEMARERATLAKFGTITIAAFRTEIESSQSHSLMRGEQPAATSRLVKDELAGGQSSALSGQMPAPQVVTTPDEGPTPLSSARPVSHTADTRLDGEAGGSVVTRRQQGERIHEEKTVVTNPSQRSLKARSQATQLVDRRAEGLQNLDEGPTDQVRTSASRGNRRPEATQLVRPQDRDYGDHDDDSTDGVPGDATSIDVLGGKKLWIGAGILVVVILGIGVGIAASGDPIDAPIDGPKVVVERPIAAPVEPIERPIEAPTIEGPLETPAIAAIEKPIRNRPLIERERAPVEKPIVKVERPRERAQPVVVVDSKLFQQVMRSKANCVTELIRLRKDFPSETRFIQVHTARIVECARSVRLVK
ncbi:MAG: serine/threonine-protein kinase [Deltaproteobacteria bacterium]|nr:serine/threonine-protein kinase [Deltaproteobacteria bacterium]